MDGLAVRGGFELIFNEVMPKLQATKFYRAFRSVLTSEDVGRFFLLSVGRNAILHPLEDVEKVQINSKDRYYLLKIEAVLEAGIGGSCIEESAEEVLAKWSNAS